MFILQPALNPPFFVCGVLFVYMSLSTDSMSRILCVRHVYDFQGPRRCRNCQDCQHCCAVTVVKYVKQTCKTVHSIPKETGDKVTRFKQQKQVACVQGKNKNMTRCARVQSSHVLHIESTSSKQTRLHSCTRERWGAGVETHFQEIS